MLTFLDHFLLWGSFFLLGFIIGLLMTYFLMQAGKGQRY